MRFKQIIHTLGLLIIVESLFMAIDILVTFIYDQPHSLVITYATLITLGSGSILYFLTFQTQLYKFKKRESFLMVSLIWILMSLFGTLPFLLTHAIPNFVDAFFETVSGFTTTGSSILTNIEALPPSVLFWRSETHLLGGMGIIVFAIAILPYLHINGTQLFFSEASIVVEEKVRPRIYEIAQSIWLIYAGFVLVETVLLRFGGMSWFDSWCHAFATIGTGGFSTKNASVAAFSPYIQYVIMIFMILAGINFIVHTQIFQGRFKTALKNQELRLYLTIILLAGGVITLLLYFIKPMTFENAFRDAFFQVSSIITATGFATDDYIHWPRLAMFIIFLLMFVGASAGSTGGGIKVIRHLIFFKQITINLKRLVHPNAVLTMKYNGKPVKSGIVTSIINYIFIYIFIFGIGTLIMLAMNVDLNTSVGSVLTTMGGIGPGFGLVGPAGNFSMIPVGGKILLTITMLLGRLEIYPLIILLTPAFWKNF